MSMQSLIRRSVLGAAAAIFTAAPAVFAQGQEIFEWSGRVDREVQVTMRGNQIWTRDIGGGANGRYRSRVARQLPRTDGQVYVQLLNGRGNVDVIQQPSSRNGYTTIVRIRDAGGGSDNYRIAAYWQNYSNGDYVGRGRGRGRDRGRDDIYRSRTGRNGEVLPSNGRNGQSMLHWTGNVDGELEIRIQNGRVTSYRNLSGSQPTGVRVSSGSAMPRSNAQVSVYQNSGRGTVSVIQQPSAYNGYTTVLRIRDPQGGYGYYDFDLSWR